MGKVGTAKGPGLLRSIGTKLAIIFLVLAIVPMAGTASYNLAQGQTEILNVAEENLLVLSRSVASEIDQLLIDNLRTSAALSGEPQVIEYMAAVNEVSEALFPPEPDTAFEALQQKIRKRLAYDRIDELETRVYKTFENFAKNYPHNDAPGLFNAEGIIVAVLGLPQVVGLDRSFRDYFIAAGVEGQPFISDVTVGRSTGVPGVYLANPVRVDNKDDGEILGISNVLLTADSTIWPVIDDVQVGREGIAYLLDSDGVIIAHPNRDLLYHSLAELPPEAVEEIQSVIRFGTVDGTRAGAPTVPESLGITDLAQELLGTEGSGSYRYYSPLDDRYHVVGYTWLKNQNWIVVVDLPEAQFLAPLDQLSTIALISVGVVGLVVLGVSLGLAQSITRPIRRLSDAAVSVERGEPFDPEDIADVTRNKDETGQLGRVFSAMVQALRRRVNELHTVYEIGQGITATVDVDETLQTILELVRDVIPYDGGEITLLNEPTKELLVTAGHGEPAFQATAGTRYRLDEGFSGAIGQARESLLIADVANQPKDRAIELTGDLPIRSLLGVPLLIGDRLVGTLELVSREVNAFDENDLRLLETIAPQASIAIEKAQQVRAREQQLQRQIEQLRVEIDLAKRDRQVAAITENEAFQDLKQRAAEMRRRRAENERSSREQDRSDEVDRRPGFSTAD